MDDFSSVWWDDGCLLFFSLCLSAFSTSSQTNMYYFYSQKKKIGYCFRPQTLWSFFFVSPNSLQDERSPTLWDQCGSQLRSGRQRYCQGAGWPRRHSRQNHQQRPEEEKGSWPSDGVSGPLCLLVHVCWLPNSALEWGYKIAGLETLYPKHHENKRKRKCYQAGNIKVSFSSRSEGGRREQSKSQAVYFSGDHKLWNEDFGIFSRKDSATLDKEIDLSAFRTGMKAMSVFELCSWYYCNEDKWTKSWNHILF